MAKIYAFIDGCIDEEEILKDAIGWSCPASIDYTVGEYGTLTVVQPLTLEKAQELLEWGFDTGRDIKFETVG